MILVDEFYRECVRPLGNLVILFAQAEAGLLDMVWAMDGREERDAHAILNCKDPKSDIENLVRQCSRLDEGTRKRLVETLADFWADKERLNRYMHDEWYVTLGDEVLGVGTRGLPRKKKESEVVWGRPKSDEIWALARKFRDHEHTFTGASYWIRKDDP